MNSVGASSSRSRGHNQLCSISLKVHLACTPLSNVFPSACASVCGATQQPINHLCWHPLTNTPICSISEVSGRRQRQQQTDSVPVITSSPKHGRNKNGSKRNVTAACDTLFFFPPHHVPLIEVVVRVQTQHVPVIQAEGFELPHAGVIRSTG